MNKLQLARDKWLHAQLLAQEAKMEYLYMVMLAERVLNVPPRVAMNPMLLRKQAG